MGNIERTDRYILVFGWLILFIIGGIFYFSPRIERKTSNEVQVSLSRELLRWFCCVKGRGHTHGSEYLVSLQLKPEITSAPKLLVSYELRGLSKTLFQGNLTLKETGNTEEYPLPNPERVHAHEILLSLAK